LSSNRFHINSDGNPEWNCSTWRITVEDDQIRIWELEENNPIDPEVAKETIRSIISEIVAGSEQYDASLTQLVREAQLYRTTKR